MATLEEIKKENERLRNQIKAKEEILSIGRERNRLLKQNKQLIRRKKFGGAIGVAARFGRTTAKVGGKIGKGLFNIAKRIDDAERREEMLRAKMEKARSMRGKSSSKRRKR